MAANLEQLVKEIGSMSVIELSDFVKTLEETFGVTAAMPTAGAAAAPAAGAAAEAEKTEFKVILKEAGSEKIKVIKALKAAITSLSLADAKDKVEKAGDANVIAEGVSKADAEKIKKELEAAGAKVTIS